MTLAHDIFYSVNEMFNEGTELSPDLVWLLLCGKTDDNTIIDCLVRQYYQKIYQLALPWLIYPEEAHRAARETFQQATMSSNCFRGRTNIYEWLVTITTRICQIRLSRLEKYHFLNPKLIKSMLSKQSVEVLTPDQIEHSINKIKIQVKNQRVAKTNRSAYQVLGLISFIILAAFLAFRLSSS